MGDYVTQKLIEYANRIGFSKKGPIRILPNVTQISIVTFVNQQ